MGTDFAHVRMKEDKEMRIKNKDFDLSAGDVLAVPQKYAGRMVNRWNLAEYAGERYEVGEQDVVGEVKLVEGAGSVSESEDSGGRAMDEMSYNDLRSLASDLGVKANGTKEELKERIENHGLDDEE